MCFNYTHTTICHSAKTPTLNCTLAQSAVKFQSSSPKGAFKVIIKARAALRNNNNQRAREPGQPNATTNEHKRLKLRPRARDGASKRTRGEKKNWQVHTIRTDKRENTSFEEHHARITVDGGKITPRARACGGSLSTRARRVIYRYIVRDAGSEKKGDEYIAWRGKERRAEKMRRLCASPAAGELCARGVEREWKRREKGRARR